MSVREVTMYTIVCDRCGCDACHGDDELYEEPSLARAYYGCEGWGEIGGNDYCPECLMWNDDETELIPKP